MVARRSLEREERRGRREGRAKASGRACVWDIKGAKTAARPAAPTSLGRRPWRQSARRTGSRDTHA